MKPTYQTKEAWEIRYLEFDLTDSLATADTISSITVTIWEGATEKTTTMILGTPSFSGAKVYAFVQAGTAGTDYYVRVRVTTTNGEKLEDDLLLRVRLRGAA